VLLNRDLPNNAYLGGLTPKLRRLIHHRVTEHTEEDLNLEEGTVPIKAMYFTTEFTEVTEKPGKWEQAWVL
jgi:hypothetical protein